MSGSPPIFHEKAEHTFNDEDLRLVLEGRAIFYAGIADIPKKSAKNKRILKQLSKSADLAGKVSAFSTTCLYHFRCWYWHCTVALALRMAPYKIITLREITEDMLYFTRVCLIHE